MTYKILGQRKPNDTLQQISAPAFGQEVVASTLVVCNPSTAPAAFQVAANSGTGGLTTLAKSQLLPGETVTLTLGITLGVGDELQVAGNSVEFTLFGALYES